jgi:triacylglycerol esterase/lipase EstA (alpha/beta hydrolase family)
MNTNADTLRALTSEEACSVLPPCPELAVSFGEAHAPRAELKYRHIAPPYVLVGHSLGGLGTCRWVLQ